MQALKQKFLLTVVIAMLVSLGMYRAPVALHQHFYDHVHAFGSHESTGHVSHIHDSHSHSHGHHEHIVSTIDITVSQDTTMAAHAVLQAVILVVFMLLLLPLCLQKVRTNIDRKVSVAFRRRPSIPPPLRAPPSKSCFA